MRSRAILSQGLSRAAGRASRKTVTDAAPRTIARKQSTAELVDRRQGAAD